MPENNDTIELTDAEVADLFGPIVDKLSTIVRGRFEEDLSLGEELRAMLAEHNVTHRKVAEVLSTPLSYVTTIVKAAQNVAEWNAGLSKRQKVDKHGLVAEYLRSAGRQTSASGLNKFVSDVIAFRDAEPPKKGQALVKERVAEAKKAIDRVFKDLTTAQRARALEALLAQLDNA